MSAVPGAIVNNARLGAGHFLFGLTESEKKRAGVFSLERGELSGLTLVPAIRGANDVPVPIFLNLVKPGGFRSPLARAFLSRG